ncbi:Predicted metal-dependent phosphoesterase TrpH, contains PHP domain [Algoriphagus locisalis]|uniref:Predicted metal-dependent phosphoesterase TrpH, contains PHP domain n=1 Tax=Algoriphagus locisalis TaxID=305507 RepID=A0A1I6XE02_9BACT|nr:CehA/McbA family metallohydrolase [Algoriphagus locisalis]SFT36232.1 Predicted metal-dependent phosphoesterase TrpH, contains PHP domain [Algoriphagus locisalis]
MNYPVDFTQTKSQKYFSGIKGLIDISSLRIFSICLFVGLLSTALIFDAMGQSSSENPWAAKKIEYLPTPASITEGVWLSGDLHLHSRHSTESTNNPLPKIFAFAESMGMSFICVTDHDNHVKGDVANHTWADPEFKSDSLILLYGAEWTTTRGHGNTFSAKPYDHQLFYTIRDQRDTLIGRVKNEMGIHLSANHPSGKDHFGYSYDIINSIEVWNSALWERNVEALMIWDDMLSSGRMITGRGGSDAHHGYPDKPEDTTKNTPERNYNYIGTPTTWVFATQKSGEAVVDALTNGRVSISVNPKSPRVEFYADLDEDGSMDMMMGDNAIAPTNPVKFRVKLSGTTLPDSTYTLKVIKNGREFETMEASGKDIEVEFVDTPEEIGRTYYRIVVEGTPTPFPEVPNSMSISKNMIGLSNPIYFNFDPEF